MDARGARRDDCLALVLNKPSKSGTAFLKLLMFLLFYFRQFLFFSFLFFVLLFFYYFCVLNRS